MNKMKEMDEERTSRDARDLSHSIVTRLAQQDLTPWYRKRNLRLLYLLMFPACLGVEMTSGLDSSMINGLQAVDSWISFFHSPRSTLLGLISAMYSLGAIVVLPFVPLVTDRLGRRHATALGSLLTVVGASMQTGAINFGMFVASRLVIGLGVPLSIVAASSLIGEISHPKERAIIGSLFNSCYYIGAIVAAGVTLGTFEMNTNWGWRIPSLLQVAPSALQIAFIYFVPESPRWLISKGRGDQAMAVIVKYHAEGDEMSEFAKAEYVQIEKTLELEKETANMGWAQLVATSGMRRRVLIGAFLGLATQWSGNGLTSYFLSKILDSVGVHSNRTKNLINLGITCWGFLNATVFAFTSSRFRRRTVYLACTISMLCVFTAWTIASARYAITGSQASSRALIAFIFLYSPCYNMAHNALTYPYLVEIFPFEVRAKGLSVFQWFSRAALFFNQFVNPIGIANAGWKYYISYCVFLLFEVFFVYFFFPETHGRTLEELAFLYEDDKIVEQGRRVGKQIHEVHR